MSFELKLDLWTFLETVVKLLQLSGNGCLVNLTWTVVDFLGIGFLCLGQVLQLDLSSFCVFLVRAMWVLDLLVVLIVVLLVMLVAFWYYFRKMVMMMHQASHSTQPLKRSTRNSGTQTSWEDQIFYMNPQGRGVIHQDHCAYLSKERGRCKELHLCQLCFKRWCVSPDSICGSLRKRMLQDSSWSLGKGFP